MSRFLLRATTGLALLCLLIAPLAVFAHEEIDAGNYVIEYGWVTEPLTAGEPNGVELTITAKPEEHGADVTGTIKLVTPVEGATVQGDKVEVTIAVEGADAHTAEESLHWHLYVDEQNILMAPVHQPTVTVANLGNGAHTVKVALAAADHSEIGKPAQAVITVEGSSATGEPKIEGLQEEHGHEGEDLALDVSALKVELTYGGETNALTLKPVEGETGKFIADFTPSRPGVYTLKLSGNLSGAVGVSPVAAEVALEEVKPAATSQTSDSGSASSALPIIVLVGLAVVILGGVVGVFLATRKK